MLLLVALPVPASAHAAFPGANGKIAFVTGLDPNFDIYAMNADGTGQTNITNNGSSWNTQPAWSPDGQRIAFSAHNTYNPNSFDIYTMNADGTRLTNITNSFYPSDGFPAWSPDGQKIAFQTDRDDPNVVSGCDFSCYVDIYTMNADGTGQTRLTSPPVGSVDVRPVWSPNGKKIAFTSSNRDGNDIYTINPDGTNETRITTDQVPKGDPAWSPDGSKIALYRLSGQSGEIYTMNADGTGHTRLTTAPNFYIQNADPAWSPDGTKIAFTRLDFTNPSPIEDIYVMNADGTGQTKLTNGQGLNAGPDWQPIPGPQQSDYKNGAQFCEADRDFLGDEAFGNKYGTNGNAANAYGKCVSQNQ
jgi:TolB protein